MPKTTEFPKFRTHLSKLKNGATLECYYYDMRSQGVKDIPLGTDRAAALEKWRQINAGDYRIARRSPKKLPPLLPRRRRKFVKNEWDGLPSWAPRLYLGAERRSKQRGYVNFMSLDEFKGIVARANGRCEISGTPFDKLGAGKRAPFSPSLDRINSSIGYTASNVRLVSLVANFAMNTWGLGPVLELSKQLSGSHAESTDRLHAESLPHS